MPSSKTKSSTGMSSRGMSSTTISSTVVSSTAVSSTVVAMSSSKAKLRDRTTREGKQFYEKILDTGGVDFRL